MSAFLGKADMAFLHRICLLLTQSGHLLAMSEGATDVSCYERKEDARAD